MVNNKWQWNLKTHIMPAQTHAPIVYLTSIDRSVTFERSIREVLKLWTKRPAYFITKVIKQAQRPGCLYFFRETV